MDHFASDHFDRQDYADWQDRADDEPGEPTATYSGEEIEVAFVGRAVSSDYGVPGSPTFTEVEDIEIDSLHILSVKVDPKTLPQPLQEALLELANEVDWSLA